MALFDYHSLDTNLFFVHRGIIEPKSGIGAPTRMGHSHAIYNPSDKPVQWMNINVSAMKGTYDAFNLGDPRVGVTLDPVPAFMAMRLDRALLRPVNAMCGGKGAGDAIPIQLNDVYAVENTSGEPLEFMIVGVARGNNRRVDVLYGDDLPRRRN